MVYKLFTPKVEGRVPAHCGSPTRRPFVDAARAAPRLGAEALDHLEGGYRQEAGIRAHGWAAEATLAPRGEYTKPRVEDFLVWLKETVIREALLPANPFGQAVRYPLEREAALKVFLTDPAVPLATHPREREIRPMALGRRHWRFCWTEGGARPVGIIQSLLASGRLPGVDPYVYLVEVLQGVATHPALDVQLWTPRLWKQHFAQHPLRSDRDRGGH